MAYCANHSWIETSEQCHGCRRSLCASCLVSFLGGWYCGPCRDQKLSEVQTRGRRPVLRPKGSVKEGLTAQAQQYLLAVLALAALPMLLALALIQRLPKVGVGVPELVSAVGITSAIAAAAVGGERLALLGTKGRRKQVAEKIAALGAFQPTQTGLFVGLTPTGERRVYQGDSNWDYGFLVVEPGWAVFYGEKAQFGLRPDQVECLEIRPAQSKGVLVDSRLVVRWRDPATGAADALRISVPDFRTRAESRVRLRDLQALLESWRRTPASAAGSLRLPPTGLQEGVRMKPYAWEPAHSYRQVAVLILFLGGVLSYILYEAFSWNVAPFLLCLALLSGLAGLSWLIDSIRLRHVTTDA